MAPEETQEIQHSKKAYSVLPSTLLDSLFLFISATTSVLYFICGYAGTVYVNSNFGVNVFVDGVQIYSTGIHATGLAQPLSVVGELLKRTAAGGGYLNHANLKFNESFRVQRMSTATATHLNMAYYIVGEG